MAHLVPKEKFEVYKECFMLYDKQRKGFIQTDELTDCMRSLGVSPTAEEIRSYKKMYEKDGKIKFNDFVTMMGDQGKKPNPEKEIIDAFRQSDVEKRGFILTNEFKRIMTTFGEELTEREIDDILREFGIQKNGFVQYEEVVPKMVRPLPHGF
ncbi:calmodulin-like protein 4 [Apostichopus japonicus]|uniref:calmodulin-like protein 4 n=1 Tax=Stichopus japonicus TaxID=307972 RepID=UPI003AB29E81